MACNFKTFGYAKTPDYFMTYNSPFGTADAFTVENFGSDSSDYVNFTVGNFAVIEQGNCSYVFQDKLMPVAGASGVMVYYSEVGGDPFLGIVTPGVVTIPSFTVSHAVGQELSRGLVIHMLSNTILSDFEAYNVIAETVHCDTDRVIFAGAYLDLVDSSPGINDNGSGSAMILEVALQVAHLSIETKGKVRFAWWGVEELGLVGSGFHVRNAAPEELQRILLYLNFDMVASPNCVRIMYNPLYDCEEVIAITSLDLLMHITSNCAFV
jgi:hypothetical protein